MDCEGISNNGSESDEGSFMDNSRSEDSPPCNEEDICNNEEDSNGEVSSSHDDDDEEEDVDIEEYYNTETEMYDYVAEQVLNLLKEKIPPSQRPQCFALISILEAANEYRSDLRHDMYSHVDEMIFSEWMQNGKKKGVEYLNMFSANTGIALPKSAEEEYACRNGGDCAHANEPSGDRDDDESAVETRATNQLTPIQQQKRRRSHSCSGSGQRKRAKTLATQTTPGALVERDGATSQYAEDLELERLEKESLAAKQADIENREKTLAEKEKQLSQDRRAAKESARKKTAEERARLESEHQKKLDEVKMLQAEAERRMTRITQLENDAKAEAERLAYDREKAASQSEVARRRLELRLAEGRTRIEEMPRSLDEHCVVVASLAVMDAVVYKIKEAFNPRNPNLSLVPKITSDFIVALQNVARHKKVLGGYLSIEEAEVFDTLIDVDVKSSLASIAVSIERNKAVKDQALNYKAPESLSQLHAALERFETGNEPPTDYIVTEIDIKKMKKAFPSSKVAENLLLNCLHVSTMVYVEEYLTVDQLFENNEDGLDRATKLWNSVQGGVTFNAADTTMLKYREEVLLPALANEKLQEDAIKVNLDVANCLTKRPEIALPAFDYAQKRRFDGNTECNKDEDYCASSGDVCGSRRRCMVYMQSNLSAPGPIQQRLPDDLFQRGYEEALLLSCTSFCRNKCNFFSQGSTLKPGFFKEGHDMAGTAKGIRAKLSKMRDVKEMKVIIDHKEHIDSLNRLFSS